MITVRVNSEEDLVRIATEFMFISVNLRRATTEWHKHFGSERKTIKENWEKKMDKLLRALEINQFDELEKFSQIEIILKDEQ